MVRNENRTLILINEEVFGRVAVSVGVENLNI